MKSAEDVIDEYLGAHIGEINTNTYNTHLGNAMASYFRFGSEGDKIPVDEFVNIFNKNMIDLFSKK